MNYLAHLFLSEDIPEGRIGNFLGDFVKTSPLDQYPLLMRRGIALHHKIDLYTDTHSVVHTSIKRITPDRRRYAGVLIDVFYDHFLAVHWSQYSAIPLHDFARLASANNLNDDQG